MSVSASRPWRDIQLSTAQGSTLTNSSTANTPLATGIAFGNAVNNIQLGPSQFSVSYVELEVDILEASAGGTLVVYFDPNGGNPSAGSSPTGFPITGVLYGTGQYTYKIWLMSPSSKGTLQIATQSGTASSTVTIGAVRCRVVSYIEYQQP
ncbi:MAG: hypothetical protein QW478_07195 [Candidatus Micrarchaeaceae archaeon]